MVFNLSERRYDLSKFNPQVLDFGWPQHLAPPLERLCSLCKSLESWLNSDPNHVAVLHSKGDKGRIGVVIAAYMHYVNMSAKNSSAEQALDRLTMKRFYDDKLSSSMHPSQRRYVQYFAGLLSGSIKLKNRMLYLHHLIIHGVPNFEAKGGCRVFIKIYQGMQAIYTSSVYSVGERARRITMKIEPSLPLKGDILIKCYHKRQRPPGRFPVFRLQFHTCTLDDDPQADKAVFLREELDDAIYDSRFPFDGRVELQYSGTANEILQNGALSDGEVLVDSVNEPMVKWDSYENFDLIPEDNLEGLEGIGESPKLNSIEPHTEGPLDGSLYATVNKKRPSPVPALMKADHQRNSLGDLDHTISMDSGISSASGAPSGGTSHPREPSPPSGISPGQATVNGGSEHPSPGSAVGSTSGNYYNSANKFDQTQLDELINGMLRDIESIPDAPNSRVSIPPPRHNVTKFSTVTTTSTKRPTPSGRSSPTTSGVISVNGTKQPLSSGSRPSWMTETVFTDDEESLPYHSRKTSMPFSYGIAPDSPAIQRRRFLSDSNAPLLRGKRHEEFIRDLSISPEPYSHDETSLTWLQRQQQKLRARKEGRGLEDRQQIEHKLIQELRSSSYTRKENESDSSSPSWEPPSDLKVGNQPQEPVSSRENSPSKTSPLHVHTYNGYSTTLPPGANAKPPVAKVGSAPCSPVIPSRTSSRDITKNRFQQWQPVNLSRQKSDTSHDRERPFVSVKRSHQTVRDQMTNGRQPPEHLLAYGNAYPYQQHHQHMPQWHNSTPQNDTLMALLEDGKLSPVFSDSETLTPDSRGIDHLEQSIQALSYRAPPPPPLNYQMNLSNLNKNEVSPKEFVTPVSSPVRMPGTSPVTTPGDRPATPSFPVAPRTPYVNQDSPVPSTGLPPKSPTLTRKERSPSPATIQALRQGLSGQSFDHPPSSSPFTENGQSSPSIYFGQSRRASLQSLSESGDVIHHHPLFVKDTSKFWYKPDISRENAISLLKDKAPGSFIVRDSNSFPGAYGLALKVAIPPPNIQNKSGDISNELVRHFLIEPTNKGVRLKGCPNEPVFGSLSALVYQHSITALALPCKLVLPESDLEESLCTVDGPDAAAVLLSQGAACNVLYLNTVDLESLTGPQAVRKALAMTLDAKLLPEPVPVHFKASNQGITLTDNNRKLFFRRHYPANTITHCGLDPDDCRWTIKNDAGIPVSTNRCFGFVARKPTSKTDNQCHVFAELDPDQPASAIVNFINKVMTSGPGHSKVNMV